MDLRYIRDFIAVAETKNFSEAAENLYISQPSLSGHIKAMEKELGVLLFNRTSRHVELSRYGQLLLPYARQLVSVQDQYLSALAKARKNADKDVSIAFAGLMSPYNIADIMADFRSRNPDVNLTYDETVNDKTQLALLGTTLDFLLVRADAILESDYDLAMTDFTTDKLAAVVHKNHPLARKKAVHVSALAGETILSISMDQTRDSALSQMLKAAGIVLNTVICKGEQLIDLAAIGEGIAIMLKRPAQMNSNPTTVVLDLEPVVEIRLVLAYSNNRPMSAAAKKFLGYIQSIQS